jgi:cell division protein FtsA
VKSPMFATTVGLVLSGFRALDVRENRYKENTKHFGGLNSRKDRREKGSDIFRKIIDKTKGLLIDDIDGKEDY